MLKLRLEINPNDAKQMLALSAFAAALAGEETAAPAKGESSKAKPVKVEEPEPEKEETENELPKRKRRTRAEIKADEKKQALESGDDGEEAEHEEAEEENDDKKKITLDDVRRAVAAKKGEFLQDMKDKLKTDFNARTVNDLDEDDYRAFWQYVEKL